MQIECKSDANRMQIGCISDANRMQIGAARLLLVVCWSLFSVWCLLVNGCWLIFVVCSVLSA
jgi:hypothetical protein